MKEECEACGYLVEVLKEIHYNWRRDKDELRLRLCKICSNTFIGDAIYERDENIELYRTIGWIGNYIVDEIRSAGKK
jgi:hypothetical protein